MCAVLLLTAPLDDAPRPTISIAHDRQTGSCGGCGAVLVHAGKHRFSLARAIFVNIVVHDHTLVISGKSNRDEAQVQYLHRGIAGRSFERRFELADFIKVAGAALVNGLLHVELKREVPEQMKPRTIKIESKTAPKVIKNKAA
ncbi:MAG: Hsp20 family protein [Rhodospirillaceae bacterium]|nr:Hsp20 family protein [Rhodospirillales bacterium]